MKTIVSALLALSVLAGIAAPASAATDAKNFYEAARSPAQLNPEPAGNQPQTSRRTVMKTIVSALLALSVLAGIAAPASAAIDAKSFYEQLDRQPN